MASSSSLQMTWQPSLLRRRKLGLPPLGLKNLGNTCYLNSVLQCLTYTPPLANFCVTSSHSSVCPHSSKSSPASDSDSDGRPPSSLCATPLCPLCLLECQIARSHTSLDAPLAPSKIRRSLRVFARHFRIGRQEDAHEFLRYVIDACHTSCLKLKRQTLSVPSAAATITTVFKQIFGGALQSQVKCLSCGAESNKIDDIMDISLDIFQTSSLLDAMRNFFQPELLDGFNKYNCNTCNKLSPARKQMFFLQAPNILVIQLKRFEGIHGSKIDRPIAFEEVLKLSNYMSKSSQDPQPVYKLFGSIVHSGYSPESGHYYAYIKDAVGCWYCCNDSHVTLSTIEEVLSEKAYILFFSRANKKPGLEPKTELAFTSNGIKPDGFNGYDKSGIKKACAPSKQPVDGLCVPRLRQKDIVPVTKNGHVNSQQKVVVDSKRLANVNGNGNVKTVDGSTATIGIHNNHPTSSFKEKPKISEHDTAMCASKGQKGIEKCITPRGVSCDSRQTCSLANGDGTISQYTEMASKNQKLSVANNQLVTKLADGRESDSFVIAAEGNTYTDAYNSKMKKRKLLDIKELKTPLALAGPCQVFSGSEFEKFKQELAYEASSALCCCDWVSNVRNFMRTRKRLHAQLVEDSMDLKKLLIADARKTFISQLPESLKEDLIGRLKKFCSGEKLLYA